MLNSVIMALIPSINGILDKGIKFPVPMLPKIQGLDLLMDNGYFVLAEIINTTSSA